MDELNKRAGAESASNSADSLRDNTDASVGGERKPQVPPRTITSKRVVIPPEARRASKKTAVTSHQAEPKPAQPNEPTPIVAPPPSETTDTTFVESSNPAQPEAETATTTAASPDTLQREAEIAGETATASLASNPAEVETETAAPQIAPAENQTSVRVVPSQRRGLGTPTQTPDTSGRGLSAATSPYLPSDSTSPSFPIEQAPSKGRTMELVLWGIALVILIGAVIYAVTQLFPNFLNNNGAAQVPATATVQVAIAPTKKPLPTTTQLPTKAPTQAPNNVPTLASLIFPTPPANGEQLSLSVDSTLSGWVVSGDTTVHYGDANLNAGTSQGKTYTSILQFNLRNLPTDTKILFGALELTGSDTSNLQTSGEWQIDLVENPLGTDWANGTPDQIQSAKSLGVIGKLNATELGAGRLNRLMLDSTALQSLAQQFKSGNAVLRIRGPEGRSDNLFSWESGTGGSAVNAPALHLVIVPGKYVIVTNTPTPKNVLTAAAYVVRGTDAAKRRGTPTPFPPGVATATPGGEQVDIPFETAVAGNSATAIARVQLATAIAATTGTYTPTPKGAVIIFPTFTPVVIAPGDLATATPIPADANLLDIPIDYARCNCQGRIIALSSRYGGDKPSPILLEPNGDVLGKLSGDLYYKLALAREGYSPDRTKRLIYPNDASGVQQIGYEDLQTGEITYLTRFTKGIAYDAAWSPDSSAIAFIATEIDNADQMYLYDFGTGQITTLIKTPGGQPWFKHPSWSPDSKQIVYWSSVSGHKQIWVMNRDGTNQQNISNNDFAETDPVWVK